MPANLPPAYKEAEARYRRARTVEEKLACLEEMLRIMPKHKGTDKLQADVKARIAKFKRQPKKKGASRGPSYIVRTEGAGQIALVGPPNSGKSSLVAGLTRARPEVAGYPFTTREPVPGMMEYEDIAFQLVDLPPLSDEYVEPWVYDLIRHADLFWLVVEATNSLDELKQVQRLLMAKHIMAYPALPVTETGQTGTSATGRDDETGSAASGKEAAGGRTGGGESPGVKPPEPPAEFWTVKPALLVVTHLDEPGGPEDIEILKELLDEPWPVEAVSTATGDGLDALRRRTFDALEIVRVYTKQPGKPPDKAQPFTFQRGATVGDLARTIHKEVLDSLKFARIWGADVFDGQTVQREHVLADGDVVEIHS
jgi:ribosome-interacting GTPase 1